jgi:hypothetical protein
MVATLPEAREQLTEIAEMVYGRRSIASYSIASTRGLKHILIQLEQRLKLLIRKLF